MIPACGAADLGNTFTCNLPVGHGGVHACRSEKPRREDHSTAVFETKATWADGRRAVPHAVQR